MPLKATAMVWVTPIVLLLASTCSASTVSRTLQAVYSTTAVPPSTSVDLGAAKQYAVLASTTVTNTDPTTVSGLLGVSPGSFVQGETDIAYSALPSVQGRASDNAAEIAMADAAVAYDEAAARVNDVVDINIVGGDIGGLTFTPGHYRTAGSLKVTSGTLYLQGDGVFIFQMATTFSVTVGLNMILQDGAQASNIFWVVGTSATFEASSEAVGTFMAQQGIIVASGASITGRLISINAQVAMESSIVVFPECPSRVELLSAEHFTVLAYATITNNGATTVGGLIGVSPGSAITGETSIEYSALPAAPRGRAAATPAFGNPDAATAKAHITTAYNDAAGRVVDVNNIIVVNIGGQTFTPGLYKTTGSLEVSSGDLYLSGNGVFIFQMETTLLVTVGRKMILQNGAQACNIFWRIGSAAMFMDNSESVGTFMAYANIDALTGTKITGRLFSLNEAVNLLANVVDFPCPRPSK